MSQSNNYAVILGEVEGTRRLPIVIGGFEAQAIAITLERMNTNRPLTHDLFKSTLDAFNISLHSIVISDLVEGIFYAQLICVQNGEKVEIDSRTSDALAMAVRCQCPIYTYDFILEAAGVALDEPDDQEIVEKSDEGFVGHSLDTLGQMLEEALNEENYEKAAQIRDEIKRRKGTS
jgi:bifunctional DNase/RNase